MLYTILDCFNDAICEGNAEPGYMCFKQFRASSGFEQLCYYICQSCTGQTKCKLSLRAHFFKYNSTKLLSQLQPLPLSLHLPPLPPLSHPPTLFPTSFSSSYFPTSSPFSPTPPPLLPSTFWTTQKLLLSTQIDI